MNISDKHGWDHCPDSNAERYIDACKRFVENDEEFKRFRQDKDYGKILEGGEYIVGSAYLERIRTMHDLEFLKVYLERFKENDMYGSPTIFNYDIVGEICPNTIHYICTLLDITKQFKGYNFKKIVEIGAGFGALCKIFSSVYSFDQYIIVDLPAVVKLCEKYLSNFSELSGKVSYVSCDELEKFDFSGVDLCISEAALAECGYDTQKMYIEKIVNKAKMVYITYNTLHISSSKNSFDNLISNTVHKESYNEINPMNSIIVYKW
jgi:putative sugar O-methyltransferase